jgi:hypothetical protein
LLVLIVDVGKRSDGRTDGGGVDGRVGVGVGTGVAFGLGVGATDRGDVLVAGP